MKAKKITEGQDFKPVTLEIIFEAEDELAWFKKLIGQITRTQAKEITGVSYPSGNPLGVIYQTMLDSD